MLAKRAECKRCTDESTIQTCAIHLPPIVRFKFFFSTIDNAIVTGKTGFCVLRFIFHPNAERISLHGGHQFRIFKAKIHTWPNNDGGKKNLIITWYNNTYTHVKINYKLGSTCKHENALRGLLILWPNVSQIANQYVHQVQGTEITARHSKITIRNAGSRHL